MNCYDCHSDGDIAQALGICHDCGAGVYADHATEPNSTSPPPCP